MYEGCSPDTEKKHVRTCVNVLTFACIEFFTEETFYFYFWKVFLLSYLESEVKL